jgi:hypothetical protein
VGRFVWSRTWIGRITSRTIFACSLCSPAEETEKTKTVSCRRHAAAGAADLCSSAARSSAPLSKAEGGGGAGAVAVSDALSSPSYGSPLPCARPLRRRRPLLLFTAERHREGRRGSTMVVGSPPFLSSGDFCPPRFKRSSLDRKSNTEAVIFICVDCS